MEYYLFFEFVIYIIYFCVMTFAIAGFFNICTNISSNNCLTIREINEKIIKENQKILPYEGS